ncbi:MAG: RNA 2',3'-cyclic phosphodiesterase [Phototrophicales bacterium]|nr:MAG: RNA 2',3'-cyclic phosphodiesterase [Phototrophicales bacterium]RMG75052.1 MAG: RNA 2',3'-cyclic phosphodiesterase [Chloroflexota bacterium]
MRLFTAVPIPQPIQDLLHKLYTNIPTARWVDMANLHLTLKFIGEVDDTQASGINTMLRTVQSPAFDLQLKGIGVFPQSKRKPPRVLWVGISKSPELFTLQKKVEAALATLGILPEDRPFSPHLTLARFKTQKPLMEVERLLTRHADFQLPPFRVTHFQLIQSQLTPQGARYTLLAQYPLQGDTDE